jgi:hypothetical protein
MSLVIIGGVADFVALALIPQSIVASLGCLTLVAQAIWAPLLLGEMMRARHYVAILIIILGVSLAVTFGPRGTNATFTYEQLISLFTTPAFIGYAVVATMLAAALVAAILTIEQRFDLPPKPMLCDYFDEGKRVMRHDAGRFHRVSYAMLSGVIGAQSVLLGKMVGLLISMVSTADRIKASGVSNVFLFPPPYIFIILVIAAVVAQIHFLNEGLARFQSLYIVPVFQATWTLVSIVGGLVVFQEWQELASQGTTNAVLFPLGIALSLFGVYYTSTTPPAQEVAVLGKRVPSGISDYSKHLAARAGEGGADTPVSPSLSSAVTVTKRIDEDRGGASKRPGMLPELPPRQSDDARDSGASGEGGGAGTLLSSSPTPRNPASPTAALLAFSKEGGSSKNTDEELSETTSSAASASTRYRGAER